MTDVCEIHFILFDWINNWKIINPGCFWSWFEQTPCERRLVPSRHFLLPVCNNAGPSNIIKLIILLDKTRWQEANTRTHTQWNTQLGQDCRAFLRQSQTQFLSSCTISAKVARLWLYHTIFNYFVHYLNS